jgi:hypothetical protein
LEARKKRTAALPKKNQKDPAKKKTLTMQKEGLSYLINIETNFNTKMISPLGSGFI